MGDKTFEILSFDELSNEISKDSNSISIIVKHLVGNMLSRWTNFLTEDGEKEWRHRDQEFEDTYKTTEDLIENWNNGWKCLFTALKSITVNDLDKIIYIRNEAHTVNEAILMQLSHYPYHIGQMVFLGKLLKGKEWQSLSIPKSESLKFNVKKFIENDGKHRFQNKA